MQQGTNRKLQLMACHEAGHGLAAYLLGTPLEAIVLPDEQDCVDDVIAPCQNIQAPARPDWKTLCRTQQEMIQRLCGPAAQETMEDLKGWRHSRYGMGADRYYALSLAGKICSTDEEAQALMKFMWLRAKSILTCEPHWVAIMNITAELLDKRALKSNRIAEMVDNAISMHSGSTQTTNGSLALRPPILGLTTGY